MTSKIQLYNQIKKDLTNHKFIVSEFQEIAFGLQFFIKLDDQTGMIRIYESKKGVKVDFSQIKDLVFLQKIKLLTQ